MAEYCKLNLKGSIPGVSESKKRFILKEGPMKLVEKQGKVWKSFIFYWRRYCIKFIALKVRSYIIHYQNTFWKISTKVFECFVDYKDRRVVEYYMRSKKLKVLKFQDNLFSTHVIKWKERTNGVFIWRRANSFNRDGPPIRDLTDNRKLI